MAKKLKPFIIGNSRSLKVTVSPDPNNPIDITGDKFYFTVKESVEHDDSQALIQESVVAAGADAANGIVILTIPAASTALMSPETYQMDIVWLKLVSAPGGRVTIHQDEVSFVRPVTRAQT